MIHSRSWADKQFADDAKLQQQLPASLRERVLTSSGSDFLVAISQAALVTGCTEIIFTYYEHLTVEIAARWISSVSESGSSDRHCVAVLGCLAKIFTLAKYLWPTIKDFLSHHLYVKLHAQTVIDSDLETLLLALFRLLSADPHHSTDIVKPTFLSAFINHGSPTVRYLAIQCMCIVMHFADVMQEKLVHAYIGSSDIPGLWEGKEVNFRLLKLLEESRWRSMSHQLQHIRMAMREQPEAWTRQFADRDLSLNTAAVGTMLVPRTNSLQSPETRFVRTPTALHNLESIGRSLLLPKPILVVGSSGSGKKTLIHESARLLNQFSSLITLHLNEQTDAKSLLGVHTSSASGDSFIWQSGVLTKALEQGRWVLIENIDRAPSEVLGVLRPIIEKGELFLPSRKETIRPSEGFRIFATIKSAAKHERALPGRQAWIANDRLWSVVTIQSYSNHEIHDLLTQRYPQIVLLLTNIEKAHEMLREIYATDPRFRVAQGRLPSLGDLMKWCRRTAARIALHGLDLRTAGMPDQMQLDILNDGIDCYAAYHADSTVHRIICELIAQSLNIPPQQVDHLLSFTMTEIVVEKSQVKIGRSILRRIESRRPIYAKKPCFALTSQAMRNMYSIAAAISNAEPLLLVGETGVGKTTLVQHISDLVNQQLTVINLSQQSEAADLLGGLKPVTTRSLIIPLVDHFNTLFEDTFSSKRNEKFQAAMNRAVTKENWPRLVLLWQEAVQMAESSLKKPFESAAGDEGGQSAKRRKLASKYGPLRDRWTQFALRLSNIRTQVDRGDKHHAFAFLEGRLVQAVRAGEWLLLDEINLASADTLDHISGLLHQGDDERPSLLLTEAGNIERVVAHPNFRLFAAMNPATDTGKKDLAPGIRSRFTEVYVQSGDDDINDLVKIVETYLGPVLSSDKRAAVDLAKAYLQLKQLNEQHRLTDGAGDTPHFSIRSLVRCLLYIIQHSGAHGLRRSMYEGFAMSFFTVLSIQSESLATSLLTRHLLSNVKNFMSFLRQRPKISADESKYVAFSHHFVLRGMNSPEDQPGYIKTPSVQRNLLNLARAASMQRFPILLQGPTSAGKTSMVEYLAKFSGNHYVRINNHEHTDLQEYLGSYATGSSGKLEFREGVLVEALRKGHWIVLDELNLAPSDVLEALNRLLDDNRELLIPESQEIVRPHPNFMLFATQNPAGLYGGRKHLSRAFRNRFLELHFDDFPEAELEDILRQRTQIPPSFCPLIVQVYKALSLQRQSSRLFESRNSFVTLRDLFRWAGRPVTDKQQLARHGFMLLAERVRDKSELQVVKRVIEDVIGLKIDEDQLYGSHTIPDIARNRADIVWTPAMRRLFVLVAEALKCNEPVLLVGETGCGKTQICQAIGNAFGAEVNIYNAHSNTETGDLIGSQRPIRQRSDLMDTMLDKLSKVCGPEGTSLSIGADNIDALIAAFEKMDTSTLEPGLVEETKQSIIAYQSLFTWSDGSLVRSMKSGQHFLLDEISLADDSVLERLNSVLEPSRTILLAEKGPTDNLVKAHAGFQFLATMNPGGDYGKRELSAALRNRLTEIWVPPLSRSDDILPILRVKLGSQFAHFAQPMLDFATWFQDSTQNTAASTISLRSLLTWAVFVRRASDSTASVAFVHGALMVYVDSLGANPAGLTHVFNNDVNTARRLCVERLQSLTEFDVMALYLELPKLELSTDTVSLGPFNLPRNIRSSSTTDLVFDAPTTLRNTMRVVRALQMDRPVLLEGSPGVGKTAIVTALAAMVGKPLTRVNLSDQTDLVDLFGTDAPVEDEKLGLFSWRDGPLLQAIQTGGWILLDEMNLASQSVLEGLNSCLDHRKEIYIAELDRSFTCHPGFMLFAAQNPQHQGGGRKGLPASFVNRFTVVYADSFEKADLLSICQNRRPEFSEENLEAIINIVCDGHELITTSSAFSAGGPWELNLRDLNRWLDLIKDQAGLSPYYHFQSVIGQRFRSTTATTILDQLRDKYLGLQPELSLFHNLSPRNFQVGTAFLERDENIQHFYWNEPLPQRHLAYAKSAITAINHAWPLILVGSSGSGKSAMIRTLAAMGGADLIEFSMNADIDAMDLIGSFEQHDARRDVFRMQSMTKTLFWSLICDCLVSKSNPAEVAAYVYAYEQCSAAKIDYVSLLQIMEPLRGNREVKALYQRILERASKSQASHFAWNDGVLIDALRSGAWLVLDNANLCNPSVLDRLNSLLEPNGVLTVSEQHNIVSGERIVRPHPNFRIFLTMDPKYGELSRAMRNRSLEIYMGVENETETLPPVPTYTASSSIYRLRPLVHQSNNMSLDQVRSGLVEAYLGSLSLDDVSTFVANTDSLLDDSRAVTYIRPLAKSYMLTHLPVQDCWYTLLNDKIKHTLSPARLMSIEAKDQPQVLVYNDVLIQLLGKSDAIPPVYTIAQQLFVEVQRSLLQSSLQASTAAVSNIMESDMTALQRSILGQRDTRPSRLQKKSTNAYGFLTTLVTQTLNTSRLLFSSQTVKHLKSLLALARDVFDLFNTSQVSSDVVLAYVQIGHDCLGAIPQSEHDLRQGLDKALSYLDAQFSLQSGQSLQRMWMSWKPVTPVTREQLEARISMENLMTEFDTVAKQLPGKRTELSSIRLRLDDACAHVVEDPDSSGTVTSFSQAVLELKQQDYQILPEGGHFVKEFEWLLRKFVLQGKTTGKLDIQRLSLLTESTLPVALDMYSPSLPSALRRLAYLNSDTLQRSEHVGQRLSFTLSSTLMKSLSSLTLVTVELRELVSTVCSRTDSVLANDVSAWLGYVRKLICGILACHTDLLSVDGRACIVSTERVDLMKLAQLGLHALQPSQISQVGYYKKIYVTYLFPVISAVSQVTAPSRLTIGSCLTSICIAALHLLVPDTAFDPAVYPLMINQRHQKRVAELEAQIASLKLFQAQVTGQQRSTLISSLEQDLQETGALTAAPIVVRPEKAELHVIQQENAVILKSILHTDRFDDVFSHVTHRPASIESTLESCKTLEAVLPTLVRRLSRLNRAYDDIVQPVKWLLESASVGTKLMLNEICSSKVESTPSIWNSIPLLGRKSKDLFSHLAANVSGTTKVDLSWLEFVQLRNQIETSPNNSDATLVFDFLSLTDKAYIEWKKYLTKDQAKAEADSRYYSYRSSSQEIQEVDEAEISSLFPTYDGEVNLEQQRDDKTYNNRSTAIRLAEIHCNLQNLNTKSSTLRDYILRTLKHAGSSNPQASSLPLHDMLPGIILQMDQTMAAVTRPEARLFFNIYNDSDIGESWQILELVQRIQRRFSEISASWPEHAVPAEVLSYVDELVAFRIAEPVAKLLTKTEKLLEIVSRWQSVASRQWSVIDLVEGLTSLIIRWRRLELTSWSRLLDLETSRCEDDANAWYFIAYEAILYNSRAVADQNEDVVLYCRMLTKTVEEFLRSASLGQYSSRLKLLQAFNETLHVLSGHDQRLEPIVRCLAGITSHYRRYEPAIKQTLSAGRAPLEKDVTEQIKLASWKDTNVQSLKDSARRSHVKLFRVVKKYRALLSQPITLFKAAESELSLVPKLSNEEQSPQTDLEQLKQNTEICIRLFDDWASRPKRTTNPVEAAKSMWRLYVSANADNIAFSDIGAFHEEIAIAAAELRKATPRTFTEEDASQIRHLRERKRRLMADTMKSVAEMGVRRNLPTTELSKQSSVSIVLAHMSNLSDEIDAAAAHAACGTFHQVLDNMSGVRAAIAEHSDELTDGEVRRAVGLLEGLLSIQVDQRSQLGIATSLLHKLKLSIQPLINMQRCAVADIVRVDESMSSKQLCLIRHMSWLPHILDVSCQILDFQSSQGGFSVSELTQTLREYMDYMKTAKAELVQTMNQLPNGLSTSRDQALIANIEAKSEQLEDITKQWKDQEPRIAYLLDQIHPWTIPSWYPEPYTNGVSQGDLGALDATVRGLLDSVFVVMQAMASAQSGFPKSTDEQGWLVKADAAFKTLVKSLHMDEITHQVTEASAKLRHLPSDLLQPGLAVLSMAVPVLEQYYLIAELVYRKALRNHLETCRLAQFLTKTFVSLAAEGFCSPQKPSDSQEEQSGKLESGTGLGTGEGAEDISKDIQEDEDLSDLAKESGERQEQQEDMDHEKDAIDMGADDLDGDMDREHEQQSGDERDSELDSDSQDGIDEETGSVDDLDPSTVDEKLWDDMQKEADKEDKELKGEKQKGRKTDEQTAKGEKNTEDNTEDDTGSGDNDDEAGHDETGEDNANEEEEELGGFEHFEAENIDPHLDEQEALDLPEEMQLTGEEEGKEESFSDDGMSEVSDLSTENQPLPEQIDDTQNKDTEEDADSSEIGDEDADDDEHASVEGKAQEDEIVEDQSGNGEEEEKPNDLKTRENEMAYDVDNQVGDDIGVANQRNDKADSDQNIDDVNTAQQNDVFNEQQTRPGGAPSNQQTSANPGQGSMQEGLSRDNDQPKGPDEALQKLADVLERYHRRREIYAASEDPKMDRAEEDIDMADAEFEHMGDDGQEADAQALGAASADQSGQVDESKAIEKREVDLDSDSPMHEDPDVEDQSQQPSMAERMQALSGQAKEANIEAPIFATNIDIPQPQSSAINEVTESLDDNNNDDTDQSVQVQQEEGSDRSESTTNVDAMTLWSYCSQRTQGLSLLLTEQLRLILAPIKATKLRGDYRTGKRLNIKRIIPYIASGYKRDKIWMRRSIPSKRDYQIMIAVDDSKSMSESGADLLAFETLAMLCKSLSMLEVGDICVVGFGDQENVRIAHPFGQPFAGAESGIEVFKNFSFQQKGTDVRNLLHQSISLFSDARLRSSNDDLWQLQLILSDGHCSDHESVRQLVRAAYDQKIMIVFVIVDAGSDSIVNLQTAVVEKVPVDPADSKSKLTTKVTLKRYLEGFPFGYYVVVREVAELPGVLARVLKGWFESVVAVE